jgi:hypothetical protein
MIIDFLILGKLIGASLATISLAGAGVGIGVIFAGFLNGLARNPKDEKKIINMRFIRFCINRGNCFIWPYGYFFNSFWFLISKAIIFAFLSVLRHYKIKKCYQT